MPIYSFDETLSYFSEKLKAEPPKEDLEAGEVELVVDKLRVILSKGSIEGSINMEITLGLLLQPVRETRLQELATSNFLGINTGGCTLAFDDAGVALHLRASISPTIAPQESWEWLHRLLHVAMEWNKHLVLWEEFIPLSSVDKEKGDDQEQSPSPLKKA